MLDILGEEYPIIVSTTLVFVDVYQLCTYESVEKPNYYGWTINSMSHCINQ